MKNKYASKSLLGLVACGLAGTVTGIAQAGEPYLINITGATAQANFLRAAASTNDYIDCNRDGHSIKLDGVVQQMASGASPFTTGHWNVSYRASGSGNGFAELVKFGGGSLAVDPLRFPFVKTDGSDPNGLLISVIDAAYFNRVQYITSGVLTTGGPGVAANPGGHPTRSTTDGTYMSVSPGSTTNDGVQIDIAALDVPSKWFVQLPAGSPSYARLPGQAGYGVNPTVATTKAGAPSGLDNKLDTLGGLFLAGAPGAVPGRTVYDTRISYVPFAYVTNLGTGVQQMSKSELRHLFATGRTVKGENLHAITRDKGSGTRNASMNSLCLDPSYGRGDNIGPLSVTSDTNVLGANYNPTNKSGSGGLETTAQNARLGIAYTAAERGAGSGWLVTGRLEIIAVKDDYFGGTEYVRPTIGAVLDNGLIGQIDPSTGVAYTRDGYRAGGPATFCTIGDPKQNPAAYGGVGGPDPMRNNEAAAYMNNITASTADFITLGPDATQFSPGEFLVSQYVLAVATDFVQDLANPCSYIGNSALVQSSQDFARSLSVLKDPAFAAFGTKTLNGKVPTRLTTGSPVYSDGRTGDYVTQGGAPVAYGGNLTDRNRIAGDFNGDAKRNINDAAEMVKAYRQRTGGPAWSAPTGTGAIAGAPGTDAVIEILGDFNGDGNFNQQDLYYWADGLGVNATTGVLNRAAAFAALDAAFAGNLFGTTIATGKTYAAGDSVGDVAGGAGHTPGFDFIGPDGRVDAKDIDYVYGNFGDWTALADAIRIDLSADLNGDLKVDQADVDFLVGTVLATTYCDVNLDGTGDQADIDIVSAHLGQPGGWAQGDVDGSGTVDAADLSIVSGCAASCPADLNGDGIVDFADYLDFLNYYDAQDLTVDFNQDGIVDFSDYLEFLNFYDAGC